MKNTNAPSVADAHEKGRAVSVGSGPLLCLLGKTGGWRTRAQIGTLLEEARDCFGAADSCWDRKDWPEMLRHISDGVAAAKKLEELTK